MRLRKALLHAGYLGPLMYLLHDIVGGIVSPVPYGFVENTVSDLTNSVARGSYPLGVMMLFTSALMAALFGGGILLNFAGNRYRVLHVVGLIILVTGLIQLLTATVFPQDPIGSESTLPGMMHLIIVGLSAVLAIVLLLLVARWAYKEKNWPVFGGFTITTLAFLIGGGMVTAVVVARELAIMGLVERVSIYPFQLWTFVLACRLIREAERLPLSDQKTREH